MWVVRGEGGREGGLGTKEEKGQGVRSAEIIIVKIIIK